MRVVEGHVALTISVQNFFVIGERLTQGKVLVSLCSTSFCSEHPIETVLILAHSLLIYQLL